MSRSGYNEDCEDMWGHIRWRGAVTAAIRSKRGQAFILEMWKAMTALPEPKLIAGKLEDGNAVCAIGAVGRARGIDMTGLDPDEPEKVAGAFGIATALAREIVYLNDEDGWPRHEQPETRWRRMKKWAEENLLPVE